MKAVISLLLILVSFCVNAQDATGKNNKYKISLPEKWMGKRSMLSHLTAIAPFVFEKLEGKRECLNCKTPYTLMFFYDSLVIESRAPVTLASSDNYAYRTTTAISNYECVTTYHFRGTWVLLYNDSAIAELELVSTIEDLTIRRKFSISSTVVYQSNLNKPGTQHPNPADNPFRYINDRPHIFDPTITDILAVLEQRLRKIKPE